MSKKKPGRASAVRGGILFQAGIKEGRLQMRREVLKFTEDKYLGPDSPPADSVEAEAILSLTRELSAFMREDLTK